jgi:hypothetical protein
MQHGDGAKGGCGEMGKRGGDDVMVVVGNGIDD